MTKEWYGEARMLWETNVGSHMWGMERPESDVDVFACVISRTDSLLAGYPPARPNAFSKEAPDGTKVDYTIFEIGHVVNQLVKANVNFLWGVFSPIRIKVDEELRPQYDEFMRLARISLSKECYHSIHGLARSNFEKYIRDKNLDEKTRNKKARQVVRTIQFGIHLLEDDSIIFAPVWEAVLEDIPIQLVELERAHSVSKLPEMCPNEKEIRDWLVRLRLEVMKRG
jgi:predicted nucleotidyltransferase